MKINKLSIQHFKTYEEIELNFTENINIFTGVNNCGKTTILEAIALWNECFVKLVKKAKSSDKAINLKKDDYRLGNKRQNYFDFDDIVSVRSPKYKDIFHKLDTSKNIILTIEFKNSSNTLLYIGFVISKASGNNYDIYLYNKNGIDYQKLNDFFTKFPNPINTIYASPVANILTIEEFERDTIIKYKIQQRKSIEIIRNRLSKIRDENEINFLSDLSFILTNSDDTIALRLTGDYNKNIFIRYSIKLNTNDIYKDISLLGSGTLQIIEILLSLYEKSLDLNLILLDEPDSHIHRDIQKRLILLLEKHTQNTQIFITTHNESLIRSSNPKYIFHLEKNTNKSYYPIGHNIDKPSNSGLQSTKKLKILKELGGEDALDFINALESEKLIFVEGKYDPLYIQLILDKKFIDKKYNVMYWSFEGVNNIFKHINSYRHIFSNIKNEKTLWDKSILIFDKDYLTKEQSIQLSTELKSKSKLNIPVHIWSYYTFESVVLTDISKFAKLLKFNMKNNDINIDDIKSKLTDCIIKKCKSKLEELETKKYEGSINKWLKEKSDLFTNLSVSNNCIQDYHSFYRYLKSELEANNYAAIATKDDIVDICKYIYEIYNFKEYSKTDIFFELIKNVEPSTWFEEWDKIIDLIK